MRLFYKELEAFASSTRDIPVGSSLFSVELRPEPAAEKKALNDRLIPSPSPRPLPKGPKGEGEPLGSSGRAECAKAFGRVGDGRTAVAASFGAWDRSRHSPSLDEAFACSPSPRGRGRGEGEGFVRFSIASSIALIPPKTAKNLPVFERSFITNDLQNELLRRGGDVVRLFTGCPSRLQSAPTCFLFLKVSDYPRVRIGQVQANDSPSPGGRGPR